MNIHHAELFYYVARFGGISAAVRNIPYGIQQPAVSGQILQLEEDLGVTLFHRRPFALTPPGAELYEFIKPFFDGIESVGKKLRGGGIYHHLRVGGSEIVLRDHLPEALAGVRKKFPGLKVTLRNGYQPQLESWLEKQELDVAVTLLESKPPAGADSLVLIKLPLALVVPKASPLRSAAELWKRDKIDDPLISLPANEAITKVFQQGLNRLGVDWFAAIEVSSVELIEPYVANGYGLGVTVEVPKARPSPRVRLLPLPDFPSVNLGAIWQGKPSPLTQTFLKELQERAKWLAQ